MPKTMKAAVFAGPGRIVLREKPVPEAGPWARGLASGPVGRGAGSDIAGP